MTNGLRQLRKELQSVGANPTEVCELIPIALRLHALKLRNMPLEKRSHFGAALLKPVAFSSTGFMLGMTIVIASQSILPGNVLYPLQKATDSIAVRIHPSYRASVMMQRVQQVNELVAKHAVDQQILATLADYTNQASAYKSMPHADYAAFEFCKTNLQQAMQSASPTVRQAIEANLRSLQDA